MVSGDGECEEKDKCPREMDSPAFLRAFRVRLCGMIVLNDNFRAPRRKNVVSENLPQ